MSTHNLFSHVLSLIEKFSSSVSHSGCLRQLRFLLVAAAGEHMWLKMNRSAVSFFLNKFIYLFLFIYYFWLCWVFVAVRRLSLVAASGGYSSLWCAGFSLQWLLLLWSMGFRHTGFSSCGMRLSSCGSRTLDHRLSTCGTRA